MLRETDLLPGRSAAPPTRLRRYRILLRGSVDEAWLASFEPLLWSPSDATTTLEVRADQAALRGILNRLWDLNLDVISLVEVAEPHSAAGGE